MENVFYPLMSRNPWWFYLQIPFTAGAIYLPVSPQALSPGAALGGGAEVSLHLMFYSSL